MVFKEQINKKIVDAVKSSGILWVLILLCVLLSMLSPTFISTQNIVTILKQISMLGILAIGATLVLLSGGLDLSVGSIVALSGVCAALFGSQALDLPIVILIIIAVITGTAVGFINGVGVSYAKVPPFIMTLGLMISIRGLALLLSNGRPIFNLKEDFMDISNATVFRLGGVAVPSIIFYFIAVIIIISIILNTTVFGKWLYAVGGNEEAAIFSAINVKWVKISVYTLNGCLAGLCGILMASRINSGDATVASDYALDAIAAAVIGGVSLTGGVGVIWKVIIGALIIGVMKNGLQILGVSPFIQTIIQGLIIIIAVYFDIRSKNNNTI